MPNRVPASITPEELTRRLAMIGLSKRGFARRSAICWSTMSQYTTTGPLPAYVVRLLQVEEVSHALSVLARTSNDRVSKRRFSAIIKILDQPITTSLKPRKQKYYPQKRKLLSARNLKTPDSGDIPEIDRPETWQLLAERIGQSDAQRLHERLAKRRPRSPRRGPAADTPPAARNTDPI
jgi:hypothetical protein